MKWCEILGQVYCFCRISMAKSIYQMGMNIWFFCFLVFTELPRFLQYRKWIIEYARFWFVMLRCYTWVYKGEDKLMRNKLSYVFPFFSRSFLNQVYNALRSVLLCSYVQWKLWWTFFYFNPFFSWIDLTFRFTFPWECSALCDVCEVLLLGRICQ